MKVKNITTQTLQRLPLYLNYLKSLPVNAPSITSATIIADALGFNDVQVRKDLASVSDGGKPKIGYITADLIADIEDALGYNDTHSAVIVGVGNLGHALMAFEGFNECGLDIVAGFDINDDVVGTKIKGKPIFAMDKLQNLCQRLKVNIGIITVPVYTAQEACDQLVASGIKAIWNFAPTHLNVPDGVLVQNENMASSLVILSKHLTENISA